MSVRNKKKQRTYRTKKKLYESECLNKSLQKSTYIGKYANNLNSNKPIMNICKNLSESEFVQQASQKN